MIVDFDDFHETNHRLDLLERLRDANPLFRCTLFAPPALGSDAFWASLPEWCELAVHGWDHGGPDCSNPREAEHWDREETLRVMESAPPQFTRGFKAPGWQISDATYQTLMEHGWWCADHPMNNDRRPDGLQVHVHGDGDHWHGHIQNVCGNGLEETFAELLPRVARASGFSLIGETVEPWKAKVAA